MASQQQTPQPIVDQMPSDPAALAAMSPEERSAIYLNMIRKAMSFFVILAIVGVVLGIVAVLKH
jgi:hypothetical protein